jgi:hypothetical protein
MIGAVSCRVLSKFTQEHYLEQIGKNFGEEQFKKSLEAFYQLIEKFEKGNGSKKNSMGAIYDKYTEG